MTVVVAVDVAVVVGVVVVVVVGVVVGVVRTHASNVPSYKNASYASLSTRTVASHWDESTYTNGPSAGMTAAVPVLKQANK